MAGRRHSSKEIMTKNKLLDKLAEKYDDCEYGEVFKVRLRTVQRCSLGFMTMLKNLRRFSTMRMRLTPLLYNAKEFVLL